jgi:hypothetical protein
VLCFVHPFRGVKRRGERAWNLNHLDFSRHTTDVRAEQTNKPAT